MQGRYGGWACNRWGVEGWRDAWINGWMRVLWLCRRSFTFCFFHLALYCSQLLGSKRGVLVGGVVAPPTLCCFSLEAVLFVRNVTVAKSSRAMAMRNRPSRWRMDRLVCVLNRRWWRGRGRIGTHLVAFVGVFLFWRPREWKRPVMRLWHASPVEALMEKCILRLTLLVSNMLSMWVFMGNSACVSYRAGKNRKSESFKCCWHVHVML